MSQPKKAKLDDNAEKDKDREKEIKKRTDHANLLRAKSEALVQILQKIYDLSVNSLVNPEARNKFLDECNNIDVIYNDYKYSLDQFNMRMLSVNANFKPEFTGLQLVESLYSKIRRKWDLLLEQKRAQQQQNMEAHQCNPKVVAYELPIFAGDIREWQLFYTRYIAVIHKNPLLTYSQKLYYLLNKLAGEALSVISAIPPCEENYNLILQTLIDRYDNKRLLVSTYLNQIFKFKTLTTMSMGEYELFREHIVNPLRAMQNLRLGHIFELVLIHIALSKLDTDSAQAFEARFSSQSPSIDDFLIFVKARAESMDRIDCTTTAILRACISNTSYSSVLPEEITSVVLLPTAQIVVTDADGQKRTIRALLDSAAQSNFITQECCTLLGVQLRNIKTTCVRGFSGIEKVVSAETVNFKFSSRLDASLSYEVSSFVVDSVTDHLPPIPVDRTCLTHVRGLQLADDNFATPNKIDALIGASLFPHFILPDRVPAPPGTGLPPAIRTVFGYVIMGKVPSLTSELQDIDLSEVANAAVNEESPANVESRASQTIQENNNADNTDTSAPADEPTVSVALNFDEPSTSSRSDDVVIPLPDENLNPTPSSETENA